MERTDQTSARFPNRRDEYLELDVQIENSQKPVEQNIKAQAKMKSQIWIYGKDRPNGSKIFKQERRIFGTSCPN